MPVCGLHKHLFPAAILKRIPIYTAKPLLQAYSQPSDHYLIRYRQSVCHAAKERGSFLMNEEIIRQNWENIKEHIRSEYQLSNISYKTWIEGLTISSIDKNTVTIQIPSDKMFMLNYIENNYRILFQITITEMLNENYEIAFVLQGQKAAQAAEPEPVRSSAYNVNYESAGLNSKYRFDTFVVGSNNKFAHSA